MNARTKYEGETCYFGTEELCAFLSVGKSTARKIAKEAGAVRKIGRRVLFDKRDIVKYMDSLER